MDTKNLNYGIIGNCISAALISKDSSIDWCCLPSFDSPSVFAKILDQKKGGSFEFLVDQTYKITQFYIKKTNILVTKFANGENIFEVIDFMPRYIYNTNSFYAPPDIIRYIKHKGGKPRFKIKYNPCLEYAEHETRTDVHNEYIKSYTVKGQYDSIYLYTNLDKQKIIKQESITLTEDAYCVLSYNQKIQNQDIDTAYLLFQRTKVYWLNWSERTQNFPDYNREITRSALVLKLLSYDKSGAVLAAVTTSLPEKLGDGRNWDYRYCWLRDASMVIKVMTQLGHTRNAKRYLDFILDIIPDKDERVQIMYGINGGRILTEKELPHLAGYEKSKPVRIGNNAYKQRQHDIFGILMDVLYHQFKHYKDPIEKVESLWTIVRSIVKTVTRNWKKPDRGIWEIRNVQKHFTFSKVLCWVAIDRAIKIAQILNRNEYIDEWGELREKIKKNILKNAWNSKVNAFTQHYGSENLDASGLLMASYGFIKPDDPKYISTVEAIYGNLRHNGLMYRYRNRDDFGEPESSFTICSFWMINSLVRIGRTKEATEMFHTILKYSNHLGLYSEDIDFTTKRLLGNFPQAYSHLALIETAIILSQFSSERKE